MSETEIAAWVAAQSQGPVWRDGLTTPQHYLIIAVLEKSDQYNCVCVGRWGDEVKVKFYPTFEAWNFSRERAEALGGRSFVDRTGRGGAGYIRFMMPISKLPELIDVLNNTRGVVGVHPSIVGPAMSEGTGKGAPSLAIHPERGGGTPRIAFKRPGWLAAPAAASAILGGEAPKLLGTIPPDADDGDPDGDDDID